MHDVDNNVQITGVESEVSETYITSAISLDTTIAVNDALAFHTESMVVRLAHLMLDILRLEMVISYSAISGDGKTITVYRGVDGSTAAAHADETQSCVTI